MESLEFWQSAQSIECSSVPRKGERTGWRGRLQVRIKHERRNVGPNCGRFRCPQTCGYSCGDYLTNRYPRAMWGIIDIWLRQTYVLSVGRKTLGGTLLNCTISRCVWTLINEETTQHMVMTEEPSSKQWLFTMMDSLSHEAFVEMAVTLWAIWYARRRLIHDGDRV
jgi:hypothetical protein